MAAVLGVHILLLGTFTGLVSSSEKLGGRDSRRGAKPLPACKGSLEGQVCPVPAHCQSVHLSAGRFQEWLWAPHTLTRGMRGNTFLEHWHVS